MLTYLRIAIRNKNFFVGLLSAINAKITDNRGTGNIFNRLPFGNSVVQAREMFDDVKNIWSSTRNSALTQESEKEMFGSIVVEPSIF